ncbi:MAG TPA: serine--tRNA ligase [Chitinophagaceae bacterium]|nr:serine--tRNA ligase [Chitinophagaceae bacterium]
MPTLQALSLQQKGYMLQVNVIRDNKDWVLERLAVRHFSGNNLVDQVIRLDDERKALTLQYDQNRAAQNKLSQQTQELAKAGDQEGLEGNKKQTLALKITLGVISEQLNKVEKELMDHLVLIPNLPHSSVPQGRAAPDNVILREGGVKPRLEAPALPHWELGLKYGLFDFELGNKITGSGFPVYRQRGARLQRALISFFLDYNTAHGYQEYWPPLLVNEITAFGTGQLPDKESQMYAVPLDKLYLIPTSEVPLTNLYRDEVLEAVQLPVKMTAYTPCFRREAGSYGKEVKGLNRVHQFDKVEIVQLTHPDHSYEALDEMVSHVEELLKQLELPYRILRLCGGDMSFASALTYDFEVWCAAQQKWLEVSSVSNFETFQTNRMKIRFKDEGGKKRLLHSLNGSSLALPRILAALLENNQDKAGIAIPAVLQGYFGDQRI